MNDKRYGIYDATHWDIPLIKTEEGLFFPASPIYTNNASAFSNMILPTANHLSLEQYTKEEREVLHNLVMKITQGKSNDYERAFVICDWVSDNIYYDFDAYYNRSTTRTDAIGVLETKRSVCEGYAQLSVALLRAAGIPERIVHGHALGLSANGMYWDGVDHSITNHAWIEIFIDGRWVIADPTWDSKNEYRDGEYIYKGRIYRFFDVTPETLSHTHKIIYRS
jgi:transglutaminase-like putative cysteine protease